MAVASVVDVAVNPNDTAQRYVLWGNGRIDALGGAVPITGQDTYYAAIDMPLVIALHIANWVTGAGYMLDVYGGFHLLNGAPVPAGWGAPEAGLTHYTVPGVPYVGPVRNYVDWAWNPNGNGEGYVLSQYGQLHAFGGATASPRVGDIWTWPAARKLEMRWTPDKRGVIMDLYGGLQDEFAAVPGTGPNSAPYWPFWDAARDLVVTDWGNLSGYTLDLYGMVHGWGLNGPVAGWPYLGGSDVGRKIAVLSAADPVRFWEVWSGGQQFEFVSSTPPTVTAGGSAPVSPAATVTGTTRPVLAWTYSDPQQDSQAGWELFVFTVAFAQANAITDPALFAAGALVAESGINRTTRGVASPVDLPNDSYRLFVRARDTAGQWSAWDFHDWTQNVPVPAAPVGMSAVADQDGYRIDLQVSATTGEAADLVRFEASDDGVIWLPVRGAEAVPLAATTIATDYDPPLGVARGYRAVAYAVDPAVASAPSNTATATVTGLTYVLTAVDDPAVGGEVPAVDPSEWTRPVTAGIFQGLGSEYATVVDDGTPKARRLTLHMITHDRAEWNLLEGLVRTGGVLVYRDAFGEVVYCKLAGGDWDRAQLPAAPLAGELTPLRHMHRTSLPLVEVRPPHLGA